MPSPEPQADSQFSQLDPHSGAEIHLVYLRPGFGEETILDVQYVPQCSTTVSIAQQPPEPTTERFVSVQNKKKYRNVGINDDHVLKLQKNLVIYERSNFNK